jgi:hypothetical protein
MVVGIDWCIYEIAERRGRAFKFSIKGMKSGRGRCLKELIPFYFGFGCHEELRA